jgi:hypothetical protein
MILNLISGPRNVSTALMYSFAQRTDTEVVDEPFYAVYLSRTHAPHPGAAEVLSSLPTDEHTVREKILMPRHKPVTFLKNMAHHLEVLVNPFIADAKNIFLIRHPAQILASYTQVIAKPVMRDIGLAWQYAMFSELRKRGDQPIVIDAGILLSDPPEILAQICMQCGLAFDQRMAHWPAGPKPYDGVWAKYWYDNVHRSTGFERHPTTSPPLGEHLQALLQDATAYYEKLWAFALKA